jgi:hypothetical protein
MARCSICYTQLKTDDPRHGCPHCQQEYHESCWSELGGCATYGCSAAAVAEKPALPVLVGAGWGDSKTCPACRAEIAPSLLVCACGARFPWADAMTPAEFVAWSQRESAIARWKQLILVLFVLSLIGLTAPLAGPAAGILAYRKRKDLAGAHGTYLALGVGSSALAGVYGVIVLMLALGK